MRKERAFALVIVVSFVALLTAFITDFGYETRINVKSVEAYEKWVKSLSVALSGISGGKALLKEDFDEDRENDEMGQTDFYLNEDELNFEQELWSQVKKIPIEIDVGGEKGLIFGNIADECGKLNLNGLVDSNGIRKRNQELFSFYKRFFEVMGAENPDEIVNAIVDWTDVDDDGIYESAFYRGLEKPYEPRNGPFASVSEVKLLTVISDEVLKALFPPMNDDPLGSPFITVFSPSNNPTDICINVNTAPKEILLALDDEMDEDIVDEIIERRKEEPFKTVSAFYTFLKDLGVELDLYKSQRDIFTVNSSVFSIKSVGLISGVSVAVRTVIRRTGTSPSEYPVLYFNIE